MLGAPKNPVSISLVPGVPGRARLTVTTGLVGPDGDPARVLRGQRVLEGLARQLRTTLDLNNGQGGAAIEIAVTDQTD